MCSKGLHELCTLDPAGGLWCGYKGSFLGLWISFELLVPLVAGGAQKCCSHLAPSLGAAGGGRWLMTAELQQCCAFPILRQPWDSTLGNSVKMHPKKAMKGPRGCHCGEYLLWGQPCWLPVPGKQQESISLGRYWEFCLFSAAVFSPGHQMLSSWRTHFPSTVFRPWGFLL